MTVLEDMYRLRRMKVVDLMTECIEVGIPTERIRATASKDELRLLLLKQKYPLLNRDEGADPSPVDALAHD